MSFRDKASGPLLAVSYLAICCAAIAAVFRKSGVTLHAVLHLIVVPIAYAYLWLPMVFTAYWLGRRKVTWHGMLLFAIVEAAAVLFVVNDIGMHFYRFVYNNW